METIGSKRSYALIWCMPNNDDVSKQTAKISTSGAIPDNAIQSAPRQYLVFLFLLIFYL